MIGLDSTSPGYDGAEVDAQRVDFLGAALAAPFRGPTLLAMRHTPFATGIALMDCAGFDLSTKSEPMLICDPVGEHIHRESCSGPDRAAA